MKKTIKNFAWGTVCGLTGRKINRLVDCRESEQNPNACVCGEAYNFDNVPNGTLVYTMPLRKYTTQGEVKTFALESYHIEDMSEDYKAFLAAIDQDIPILRNMKISGTKATSYHISGILDGRNIVGRILHQNVKLNLLLVKLISGEVLTVYPDWESNHFKKSVFGNIDYSDIKAKSLKLFCNADKVKPIF